MVRNNDCGYFHATAVLPEFQGKGIYQALVQSRIDALKAAGAKIAVTYARELSSAPRLEKMGFITAWASEIFLKKF